MRPTQAFTSPYALRTNLRPPQPHPGPNSLTTPRKPRHNYYQTPSNTLRRQRLRNSGPASSSETNPPDASRESEPKPTGDDDNEASDLALPNLKELFAGSGRPGCEQCAGKGEIGCPVCEGKGFFTLSMMDTVSSAQCRMCRGGRSIPCPSCRDVVYKSVMWWDERPSEEEDPEEKWRRGGEGDDEGPRISWGGNPAGPNP